MSSPSFYSAAGNFISAIKGGVNPRTGLFNVSLPLISLRTGDLAGPCLALNLSYSPLSSEDEGFGRGFTLNLSRYDSRARKLYLSTGEEYRISSSGNAVIQQRFRSFIFKKTDDPGARYQIIHKSGLVETLTILDSMAYTTRIEDPGGRRLELGWERIYTKYRLSGVSEWKEEKKILLCSVVYPDAKSAVTTFRVLPDSSAYGYDIVFSLGDGVLRSVTSHADTPELVWKFSYDVLNPYETKREPRFLTGMESPTGLRQKVVYPYSEGMAFPDGMGLAPLPRVSTHIIEPGGEQARTETRWMWTEENYLGRNRPGPHAEWQPDMDLGLTLPLSPGYFYGSTENILDASGRRVLCAVTRRYNSFHLQVSESALRDGKTYTITTAYPASSGAKLNEQPRQYLLPCMKTETWQDDSGTRTRITRWQFDESGNPLRQTAPDGTITEYVYYPAQGEGDFCPADPHGFTRYLKRKTVTPLRIRGDEPVTVEIHTWKKRQNILNNGYFVAGDRVTETSGSVRVVVSREYYDDLGNPVACGREKKRIITLTPDAEKADAASYSRTEVFSYESRDAGLFQSATLTTHDGLSITCSSLRHSVLGLLLSKSDARGVTVNYTYDRAGRVLTCTSAPETPYEQKSVWSYAIDSRGPVTTETGPAGNQIRLRFDGAGREIGRERLDTDNSKRWFEVSSQNYDTTGEVTYGAASDWLTSAPEEQYIFRTVFEYDGWGNLRDTSSSDGVLVRQTHDPVKLTQADFAKGSIGSINLDTTTRFTELDKKNYLPRREKITGNGFAAERNFEWDGAGQLRQVTDENGRRTQYTYDAFGRVLAQTLPDGTVIRRLYAPHLTGKEVVSISVTGTDADGRIKTWILGTQTFDGLGRLTLRVSGGRTTMFTYSGMSSVPASVTLPSGKKVAYTCIPELGDIVSSMTADELRQAFIWDPGTESLLTATEGSTTTEHILYPSGSLKTEKFTQAGTIREAGYVRTLAGAVDRYTDITGKETNYERDNSGRLIKTKDNDLTTDLQYDPLGRLSSYTVTDQATKVTFTTALTYDDASRETVRTITDGKTSHTLTVTQGWTLNSLVTERVTQWGGMTVRKEAYTYDARNRLVTYKVLGVSLPQDAYDCDIKAQTYQYDALNNLITVITTLADDGSDTATYCYTNSNDPTQLTSVTHTHDKYPQTVTLNYDAEGRMTQDEAGRTLAYDVLGRLVSVSGNSVSGGYGYDALGRLVSQSVSATDSCQLYYRGGERVNETRVQENKNVRLIKTGHACVGVSDGDRLTLTAGDQHGSLLWSRDVSQKDAELHGRIPYGSGKAVDGLPGFNGEHPDPLTRVYHLGNGYRAYSPALMRFTCPDSMSPFGSGGINPYAYCAGDPVNFTDPSGHLGRPDYLWGVLSAAFTVAGLWAALLSGGLAIAAAGGIMAAVGAASTTTLVAGGLGVAADATALAAITLEDSHPEASSVLGWTSMAMGLAAGGALLSASGVRRLTRAQSVGGGPLRLRGGGDVVEAGTGTLLNEVGLLERNGGFRRPLYRADLTSPDHILKYGFRPSTDFTGTGGRSMIGSQPALIVAERLEGAIRFNTASLSGRGNLYMIRGGRVRGSSLIDNMWDNRSGLANFFDDSTLLRNSMSEASDSVQGVNYLSEAHVYHADIKPEMISLVPEMLARRAPVPGKWRNWF